MDKVSVGQLMIMGLSGKSLTEEEKSFLVKNDVAGIILFSRNIESPKQVHELNQEIQSLSKLTPSKLPFFISVDMEGGRVARLKKPFTEWPPLKKLGDIDSTTLAFKFAETMGHELSSFGFNIDYAPCIDILTNPQNILIGDRSLSTDPEQVAKLSSAIVRGYVKSNIIACAKHFPGHGNTLIDSHEDLPVEETADLQRLSSVELVPFKKVFRARLDLLMTAHIKFPLIDPEWPVTFSEIFLKKILREDLGYKKILITDDLDMKALSKYYAEDFIPVRALQAGADMILYCNDPSKPPMALEAVQKAIVDGQLNPQELQQKYQRVVELKKERLIHVPIKSFSEASQVISREEHKSLAQDIAAGRLPANLES